MLADGVIPVVPLHKLLALGGRHLRPLREEMVLVAEVDFHRILVVGKLGHGAVECAIA